MAHLGRRSQAKALHQLGGQDIAYRVLAYKFSRIIRPDGGQIDADGNMIDMGKITRVLGHVANIENLVISVKPGVTISVFGFTDCMPFLDTLFICRLVFRSPFFLHNRPLW